MILLCSGQISVEHSEALALFALQLEARGHQVAIDARFMTGETLKQTKYELAPFLAESNSIMPEAVVVLGANDMSNMVQTILGGMRLARDVSIWAVGRFDNLQEEINAQNKLAYATGFEPQILNLAQVGRPAIVQNAITPVLAEIKANVDQNAGNTSRLMVYVSAEDIEADSSWLQAFAELNHTPGVRLHLLTNARGKNLIRASWQSDLSVFSYNELPPTELLHFFDILAVFGPNIPGERMAVLALAAMGAGKVVIDCTVSQGLAASGAPVLKGTEHPVSLAGYLQDRVLPNRLEIGPRVQGSEWLRSYDIATLEQRLKVTPSENAHGISGDKKRVLFLPTNGNGLGHAQRTALIADRLPTERERVFAAFPSCLEMLSKRGNSCLPLVPRSSEHSEEYAADLLNFLRLRQLVSEGEQIVFDGGYVFDSVYRLICKLRCPATWIRRGLWQKAHVNPVALERERAFSRVIVPSEAFPELNTDYSTGEHIFKVGPIVRCISQSTEQRNDLRARLEAQFDRRIDTLVITMLGGGVASERAVQTQHLCSLLERRDACLHLVVAWPHAVVPDGLYSWENSRVIRTAHTLELCVAADLAVSASGYNSFHELLYAGVPAILIPQSAPYLDDQERRAQAAQERGLARLVASTDLFRLENQVTRFLDNGDAKDLRRALAEASLPSPGNVDAARLIEENFAR